MPTMDGIEAIRCIRAIEGVSETLAIVMVTAFSRDELMEQAGDVRFDGILEKPVSSSTVLDANAKTLGRSRARAHVPARHATYQAMVNHLRGAHVLLVEDNEINQELANDILTEAGMKVDIAADGAQAVAKVDGTNYDAVLMDWQMPVMDGFEATRRIRENPRFARLPILAMTASAMAGDREKCLAVGMNDHIVKPIDVDQLLAVLTRWIERKSRKSTSAEAHWIASEELSREIAKFALPASVDVAAALKRLRGNASQYRRLLDQFAGNHEHSVASIRTRLASGDRESAQREAHTLKGLAATVGASAIMAAARAVEQAIKHNDDARVDALLDGLAMPLNELLTAVAQVT